MKNITFISYFFLFMARKQIFSVAQWSSGKPRDIVFILIILLFLVWGLKLGKMVSKRVAMIGAAGLKALLTVTGWALNSACRFRIPTWWHPSEKTHLPKGQESQLTPHNSTPAFCCTPMPAFPLDFYPGVGYQGLIWELPLGGQN